MVRVSGIFYSVTASATAHGFRRGFSLLELIVVISITSLLAGLLMPALSSVRENARRVMCGANQRQLGQAVTMYSGDRRNRLPVASVLDLPIPDPGLLGLVRNGSEVSYFRAPSADATYRTIPEPLVDSSWDGLGHLYKWRYCDTPDTFYCPSHQGMHLLEENRDRWEARTIREPMFGNYHYVGHKDWRTGKRLSLIQGHDLILATDGLLTKSDYSHRVGYNILRGDGSVTWKDDVLIQAQLSQLPPSDLAAMRDLEDLIYELFLDR